MKTVVLLAPTPPPAGGISSWTARMMKAELKNGWQVRVVDEKVIGNRTIFGKESRRNLRVEIKRCFNIWGGLIKELKNKDAKVVHSCIPSVPRAMLREYICAVITKVKRRKFVIHYRCTVPNTTRGKFAHFMLKRLCNISDLIISLNEQTNEYLKNYTKTPFVLIPNFVSESELLESRVVSEELKTVLYVGGVIRTKGAYDILEVARRFPDISFRFVGKTDGEIEKYAEAEKITNAVFTGPKNKEDVKTELASADVFMFMTYFYGEGFSNALAEAMASGLPCIATDWAANADMIENKGGAVVNVKDIDAACNALENMKSASVRQQMCDFNINKVKAAYVDSVVIDQYVDVYEKLCS